MAASLPEILPVAAPSFTLAAIAALDSPRIDVADVRGAADAALVVALAARPTPIVVVAADADAARRLASDVAFLLGATRGDDQEAGAGVVVVGGAELHGTQRALVVRK